MNKDYTEKDELKAVCMRCLTCWDGEDGVLNRLADAILDADFHKAAMNIKVGDKVRVKTEEELLAEGWQKMDECDWYMKGTEAASVQQCGKIGQITRYNRYGDWMIKIENLPERQISKQAIAEILPPTLDEYICSLPLEERAKWFVYSRYDSEYDCHRYFSIVTYDSYFDYGEALRATIKALNGKRG